MSRQDPKSRLIYHFSRCFCWLLCAMLFRFRSRGSENVPTDGPMLMLCNHQSHLDPILLAITCSRQIRPLSRESLFVGPLGWFFRKLGAIPVSRTSTALSGLREMMRRLDQGNCMLIFPEGTRSEDGNLGALKPGFIPLARKKRPILLPAAVDGTSRAWPKSRRFPRPGRISVSYGTPIQWSEIENLSDNELLEVVTARIRQCHLEAQVLWDD